MLQYVEAFCAVVDSGSINYAAERLHLSQPALSKQIRALEAELGVQLLVRSSRGVELTPVGRRVYRLARRALAVEAGCRRAAAAWRDPWSGRLTIGAGLTLTLFTLPPVIQTFRERVPDVRLELLTGDSRESLARLLAFEVDVALVTSPVPHPEVQAVPLFVDPLVVVAAPGTVLPREIPELGGAALISFRRGSGLRQYVDQVLESHGARPDVVMEFDSIEAIKTMAGLGLGLALLPLSAVREEVAAARLTMTRLPDWPDAGRTVTLLRRRAGLRSGAVSLFTAIAREVVGGERRSPPS
ncbi:MAG: LysR family transcriptional regulator [Bacillota bacterium]